MILHSEDYDLWLDPSVQDGSKVQHLVRSHPDGFPGRPLPPPASPLLSSERVSAGPSVGPLARGRYNPVEAHPCSTTPSIFAHTDFRRHPELYRVGKGEQGVLLVEPYKSELLPHWRFKTAAEAKKSAATLYRLFRAYLRAGDFVGADMARKFLQMGWTRARRYANHKGGRKYDPRTGEVLPRAEDPEKAAAAAVFYGRYAAAREHPDYVRLKKEHQEKFEGR